MVLELLQSVQRPGLLGVRGAGCHRSSLSVLLHTVPSRQTCEMTAGSSATATLRCLRGAACPPAVSDDGLPLPLEAQPLERCAAGTGLAGLLTSPLFVDSTVVVETTGGCSVWCAVQRLWHQLMCGEPCHAMPSRCARANWHGD